MTTIFKRDYNPKIIIKKKNGEIYSRILKYYHPKTLKEKL